jgi:hypothetical protein
MDEVTPEVAETSETPTTAENTTLTGGKLDSAPEVEVDETPANPNLEYPEGFDEKTYDLATKSVKTEGIAEREADLKKEMENYKKQAQDMRKIISKGKAKETADEYADGYVPQEGYEDFYNFEDGANPEVKAGFDKVTKMSTEQALNTEQHRAVTDLMNELMTDVGALDTRTPEQREIQQKDWLREENKKLSDDPVEAVRIINQTVEWVDGMNVFSDSEKETLGKVMDSGAEGVAIVNKFRTMFGGQGKDIPTVEVSGSGLSSDLSLATEYNKPETSQARRIEIMTQRRESGRVGGLPIVHK